MPRHHGFDIDAALAVGFGAGLVWFFKGFRDYREYRVLADTPEMPIRSIPMGLVEIHGKARGDQVVSSPVSNTPCLFYRVDIEVYQQNPKGGGDWYHAATDTDGALFYVEDQTGKVLVDAHGAELDLIRSGYLETGVGDYSLVSYADSVIAEKREASLGGRILSKMTGSYTGPYRLAEYCILPGHWYDLTGTCVENPEPQDEHDRNMIVKGLNEPTFLISWRSEKELESTLRKRAALHIFGGAALSVVCLGILLSRLGWL
jgi:hypothetical protein